MLLIAQSVEGTGGVAALHTPEQLYVPLDVCPHVFGDEVQPLEQFKEQELVEQMPVVVLQVLLLQVLLLQFGDAPAFDTQPPHVVLEEHAVPFVPVFAMHALPEQISFGTHCPPEVQNEPETHPPQVPPQPSGPQVLPEQFGTQAPQ